MAAPIHPQATDESTQAQKPLMSIGWLLAAKETEAEHLQIYRAAADHLCALLQREFPQFQWEMPFVVEYRYSPYEPLPPLPLLEFGVHEKLARRWDFAVVLVPNELIPQSRTYTLGVPSSALEVAVLSTARLLPNMFAPGETIQRSQLQKSVEPEEPDAEATSEQTANQRNRHQQASGLQDHQQPGAAARDGDDLDPAIRGMAALALHLLGHVWGVEHETSGPMNPPEDHLDLSPMPFPADQHTAIAERLAEVADARLEEQPRRWRLLSFYWRTFWTDPRGIWTDVVGYKPWRLPFRMGRLTAAAAVSVVFLLLGAESWEVGTNQSLLNLGVGMWVAVLGTTLFLFWGQNLGEVARSAGWREQLIRTRIVVFFTLFIGMAALWIVLFAVSFLAASAVPTTVPASWLGTTPHAGLLLRQAAFMATLGVFGGALGGNLEDEDVVKAQLFYDEET